MDKQGAIINMLMKMDPERDAALIDRLYDVTKRMFRKGERRPSPAGRDDEEPRGAERGRPRRK